jgi:hypothetical protein
VAQDHHGGLAFEINEGFAAHVDCDPLDRAAREPVRRRPG